MPEPGVPDLTGSILVLKPIDESRPAVYRFRRESVINAVGRYRSSFLVSVLLPRLVRYTVYTIADNHVAEVLKGTNWQNVAFHFCWLRIRGFQL